MASKTPKRVLNAISELIIARAESLISQSKHLVPSILINAFAKVVRSWCHSLDGDIQNLLEEEEEGPGFVMIVTSTAHEWIKITATTESGLTQRLNRIQGENPVGIVECVYKKPFSSRLIAEKKIHRSCRHHDIKLRSSKWFRVDVATAARIINRIDREDKMAA